jgi:energy-coupling factor transporter ATP-binding protein EcfA2
MTEAPPKDTTPVLRTLSPALRGLERGLRGWLDSPHRYPISTLNRAALEGLAGDLRRQADALDVDRPLLVVMLMGGTGVGKSTLLNALAGGTIAQASFQRPTTRDPVVYYHESVKPDRLDPALRHCRLIPHDRPSLEQKILVDTPDLDSTDLTNRERTLRLLPVADVILYVGSQEKYHDQLIWKEFLAQRTRRAFAFVVNKWDRCVHAGAAGLRPDEDLLRDLTALGFESPHLFRTCAQIWVDKAAGVSTPDPPEGETFTDLVHWLEMGLSRLEIESIKARGVGQLL